MEERDASSSTLHRLAQNKQWRQCQQCRRMIELTHGCHHMTCWFGHEFCYSCGAAYNDSQQTCQCAFWDEDYPNDVITHPSQESSHLAVIQRFLVGGISLSDHQPDQSPPRCKDSYIDAMKNLHHLLWLQSFVSLRTFTMNTSSETTGSFVEFSVHLEVLDNRSRVSLSLALSLALHIS